MPSSMYPPTTGCGPVEGVRVLAQVDLEVRGRVSYIESASRFPGIARCTSHCVCGRTCRHCGRSRWSMSSSGVFRVAHYSLQGDHAHLIFEAHGKEALANGMKSIAARLARAIDRVCGRSGPVQDGRYLHHLLRTPREVRRALAYVLSNACRHLAKRRAKGHPSASRSGELRVLVRRLAPGGGQPSRGGQGKPEVARPRTWLWRIGWRRHGLVDPREVPGGVSSPA